MLVFFLALLVSVSLSVSVQVSFLVLFPLLFLTPLLAILTEAEVKNFPLLDILNKVLCCF